MGESFTLEHLHLYHRPPCHLQSLLKLLTALPLDFKLTTQQFDSCWLQKSGRPRWLSTMVAQAYGASIYKLITFLYITPRHILPVHQIMLTPLAVQHVKRPQFVVLHFHRPSWDALLLKTTNYSLWCRKLCVGWTRAWFWDRQAGWWKGHWINFW